jgi:metacaspase-1
MCDDNGDNMNLFAKIWNWIRGNKTEVQGNTGGTVPPTPATPTNTTSTGGNMSGKRYAILAASNYEGTSSQLRGCINDVIDVRKLVEEAGVTILADLRNKDMTTANWKEAIKHAASIATTGDVVFHMHSHHGTQIKDPSEADGLDEVWCPDDFDWSPAKMITDKQMASTIKSLAPGVVWLEWPDCCHSGDSIRDLWYENERPRYIPNPELVGSPRSIMRMKGPMLVAGEDRNGILLAACRSNQTSADAYINRKACGAFTHFMLQAINEGGSNATYESLMIRATQLLSLNGYEQRPELNVKPGDEKRTFSKDVLGR